MAAEVEILTVFLSSCRLKTAFCIDLVEVTRISSSFHPVAVVILLV